ncbi:MAG: DUF4230 domain-containing protein [Phycisphaerae bacterium]|nr:DUF4230 domain-containing protein [Phycisphaerae bacterium]
MTTLVLLFVVVALSAVSGVLLVMLLRWKGRSAPVSEVRTVTVAERVRAVGKLVGLEVHAKEIATSTKGWSWAPPLLLSQAKIAMIFHFEKQYFVELSHLKPGDVELIDPGTERPRYRVRLPAVEGSLRLTDVSPYDIQAGRVLGLLDVIPMNAETQRALMKTAQEQAGEVFRRNEAKYIDNARRSIEQHLGALLRMFDVTVEIAWHDQPAPHAGRMDLSGTMAEKMKG